MSKLCVSVPLWLSISQESSPQRHRDTEKSKLGQHRFRVISWLFCSNIRAMRRVIALLLVHALFLPMAIAQQQDTRPRRTQPWPAPAASTPVISTPALTPVAGPEPTIRVALTTDARSAVISTTGHLMNASGSSKTLHALDSSSVRVNPRLGVTFLKVF